MRMMLQAKFPVEPFNSRVKDGTSGKIIQRILEDAKPEAAYFCEFEGHRNAYLIINMTDNSQIPSFAEPWFLNFNAECHFRPVMTPEDLAKAGLDALAKKWA